jgi:signal transduction histidine kinase
LAWHWWQVLPPLLLLVWALALAGRYRRLQRLARDTRRQLAEEEERLIGSISLAEETVHRILLASEIGTTLRNMAGQSADLLDLAGVRIRLERGALAGLDDADLLTEVGSCEDENMQRLPIRARDREIGSFWFTPRRDRPLRVRELHFLRLMAVLTGIGVENLLFHRQVRVAGEDKARFILATTHDLRSPMATIEQIVMLLLDGYAGPLADRQRDLLVRVRSRGRHQLQLISDLLTLAAEEDAFLIPRDTVTSDFGELFDAAVESVRPDAEARSITLEARRSPGPMNRTAVRGDLENILDNLLSNAVKYTREGGRVTAELEMNDGACLLRVRDTGIGIPAASLPSLCREYFRAPNAKELTRHGTGLGLALVKRLVEKYGGTIRVESRVNEGSLFEVVLPRTIAAAASAGQVTRVSVADGAGQVTRVPAGPGKEAA